MIVCTTVLFLTAMLLLQSSVAELSKIHTVLLVHAGGNIFYFILFSTYGIEPFTKLTWSTPVLNYIRSIIGLAVQGFKKFVCTEIEVCKKFCSCL